MPRAERGGSRLRRLARGALEAIVTAGARSPAEGAWRVEALKALVYRDSRRGDLPWRTRASAIRRGFVPTSHVSYDLSRNSSADYVSDYAWLASHMVTRRSPTAILDDKLAFFYAASALEVPTPRVAALVVEGRLHGIGGHRADLEELLGVHGRLVVRPAASSGGRGVHVLATTAGGYRLDGEPASRESLERLVSSLSFSLVSEFAEQATYAASVFEATTNTIRLLTLNDSKADHVSAIAAVHRFGTRSSRPVDSWSRGGMSVAIDLGSGRLGRGTVHPGQGRRLAWHSSHPDTGARIEGEYVPGWAAVKSELLGVAQRVGLPGLVGWDVVVTADGPLVVEGNAYPDVDVLQVHAPLLRDARVRDFLAARWLSPNMPRPLR